MADVTLWDENVRRYRDESGRFVRAPLEEISIKIKDYEETKKKTSRRGWWIILLILGVATFGIVASFIKP